MKINFSGNEHISAGVSKSERFIADPESVSKCIPDSKEFQNTGEHAFSIKVEVGIGTLKGTFLINGTVEKGQDNSIAYRLSGGGFGNKASILLSIKISGDEMRTDLSWNADFDISGIISGLGQGIVKKVSEEKISEIINNVKNVLEAK